MNKETLTRRFTEAREALAMLAAWSWNSWVKWLGDHIRTDYERARTWWGR
jgi:hypothetical protein